MLSARPIDSRAYFPARVVLPRAPSLLSLPAPYLLYFMHHVHMHQRYQEDGARVLVYLDILLILLTSSAGPLVGRSTAESGPAPSFESNRQFKSDPMFGVLYG